MCCVILSRMLQVGKTTSHIIITIHIPP
jgi:hypothetical protein